MNTKNNIYEPVELVLALNSTYIPTARTTATSIAENMNFSNSKVEDIRTAVSEMVSFLIENSNIKNVKNEKENSSFKIKFLNDGNNLNVEINSSLKGIDENNNDLSLNLVKSCMDNVNFNYDTNSNLNINMTKSIN